MSLKRLILVAGLLAMSACTVAPPSSPGTVAPPTATVIAKAGTIVLTGERAFAAAELGYITAAKGVGIVADNGAIDGATAVQIRGWNATARTLLVRGKATADTAEKARIAARLFGIADSLNAIIGSK